MRVIVMYIFFLLSTSLEAQNKVVYFNGVRDSNRLVRFTGLYGFTDLTKSSNKLRFRYIGDNSGIEIWTNDNKTYNGQILCYAKSYYEFNRRKKQKHYRKVTPIDTATARKVYNLFDSLAIFNVPPEDSIVPKNQWGCNDGQWYGVEYSTPNYYSLKYYSECNIHNFKLEIPVAFLENNLRKWIPIYGATIENFISCLPKGEYAGGGAAIIDIPHQPKRKYRLKSIEESN